jgi:peptide/nickel transport system substrate-binding protein
VKRYVLFLLVLLVALIPFAGVSGQGGDDTIVFAESYDVKTFNPVLASDGGSFSAIQYLFPTLMQSDVMTGEYIPDLASWEISEDSLTYTFFINEDAVWSDGEPISAEDVKFTYEAIMSDLVESPRKGDVTNIEEINVIEEKTVEFVMKEVDCTVLGNLATNILPSHKFAEDFSDVMTNPLNEGPDISGGPYMLEEWAPDEFTRFVSNPTFWKGEPGIKYLVNRVVTDPAILAQMMASGEADYGFFYPDEFDEIPVTDHLTWGSFPLHNTPLFTLNWADPENPMSAYDEEGNMIEQPPHPLFSDVKVRQAMAMGYSKDDLLETLDGRGVKLTSSVIPTITWAYNAELEPWPYDPERAVELLDEAGWLVNEETGIREKDGVPFEFTILYSAGVTNLWDNIAIIAQDQLSDLNIKVEIESIEWGAFIDKLLAQEFDALVVGFGGGAAPEPDGIAGNIMYSIRDVVGSGFNMTSYVNPEVDELLEGGKAVPGCAPEDRAPFYKEMQRITQEEVAYDFTVSPLQFHVMNKRILGFEPGPWWGQASQVHLFTIGEE